MYIDNTAFWCCIIMVICVDLYGRRLEEEIEGKMLEGKRYLPTAVELVAGLGARIAILGLLALGLAVAIRLAVAAAEGLEEEGQNQENDPDEDDGDGSDPESSPPVNATVSIVKSRLGPLEDQRQNDPGNKDAHDEHHDVVDCGVVSVHLLSHE